MSSPKEVLWNNVIEFHKTSPLTAGARDSQDEIKLVKEFSSKVPLTELFAMIDDASKASTQTNFKILCSVLERLFNGEFSNRFFAEPEFESYIIQGINHPEESIKTLTITRLKKYYMNLEDSTLLGRLIHSDLISTICACMNTESIAISSSASDILLKVALRVDLDGHKKMISLLKTHLASQVNQDAVISTRYLNLVAQLCGSSDEIFTQCRDSGILTHVTNALDTDDILLQINVLDIVMQAARSKAAAIYLFECGIVQKVVKFCCKAAKMPSNEEINDPFHLIIQTSALRFIGELTKSVGKLAAKQWLEMDSQLVQDFLRAAVLHSDSKDEVAQNTALDAIASFACSSTSSLKIVMENQALVNAWFQCISGSIFTVKTTCLHSLALVLASGTKVENLWNPKNVHLQDIKKDCNKETDSELDALHKTLFEHFGRANNKDSMELLMSFFKKPFPEHRNAAFNVLRVLSSQETSWGIVKMLNYAGFLEFLSNNIESTKEGMEWRFSVIDALVASSFYSTLAAEHTKQIDKLFNNGPYYSQHSQQPLLDAQ